MDYQDLRGFVARAENIQHLSIMRKHLDLSGDCWSPHQRDLYAAPPAPGGRKYISVPKDRSPILLELVTRCRRCEACLRQRRNLWAARAVQETAYWPRTWFGTLTFRPEVHQFHLSETRARLAKSQIDLDRLEPERQFTERLRDTGRAVTLWLKRVRKQSGARIRTLVVAEAHESGLPHYHCLIHEMNESEAVRYTVLTEQWTGGFSRFNLVTEPRKSVYLCKYLAKSLAARVRASKGYGKHALDGIGEAVKPRPLSQHDLP